MNFTKEEQAVLSLVDSFASESQSLSKKNIESILMHPSDVVILLATVTRPHGLLLDPHFQKSLLSTIQTLRGVPRNVKVEDLLRRLRALVVLLETEGSDELIDSALESHTEFDEASAVQALARADVPWEHPDLAKLLDAESPETVSAATLVLIEALIAQFYNEDDTLEWSDFFEELDEVRDFIVNPGETSDPSMFLNIGWTCAKNQYIQYVESFLTLRYSFEELEEVSELDAIIFSLDTKFFAHKFLEQKVYFNWLDNPKVVANLLEAIAFAPPSAPALANTPPRHFSSPLPLGLADGFTTSWLETLTVISEGNDSDAFEFAALLAVAATSTLRNFVYSYSEASAEELETLAAELAEVVISEEVGEYARRSEFAIVKLLVDHEKDKEGGEELESLLVRIAAYEVLLALNAPLPTVPGLPLSGAIVSEHDLSEFVELLQAPADSSETLVRQIRTIFDAARWEREKETDDFSKELWKQVVSECACNDTSSLKEAFLQAQEWRTLMESAEFLQPELYSDEYPFRRLLALQCARERGEDALGWLATQWFLPPIASASILRDTFAVIATDAKLIDPKYIV